MNTADYWPLAKEYSIWNAAVATLQFWTADLEAHVLSSTTEQVYNAFFYTTSRHLLCQQSEEVLSGHFMTKHNAAFESKLTFEDEGYENRSENFNIPTPLRHTPRPHHVSTDDNIFFDPSTPHKTAKKVPQLTFHLLTAPHHHRTPWVLHSRHIPSPSIPCVMT